jgi:hypothetical protein
MGIVLQASPALRKLSRILPSRLFEAGGSGRKKCPGEYPLCR